MAGLHVEHVDGHYLGVTMEPVREGRVYSMDETSGEPVKNITPWEQVRITGRPGT